jgi:hypothetical protein
LIAIVTVVGVFDLIYLATSLSRPMRPGAFERPPRLLTREQILDEVLFVIGIENLGLTITLLVGYWVILKWRKGSAARSAVFVAFSLLLRRIVRFEGHVRPVSSNRAENWNSVTWHGAYGDLAFEVFSVVHHPFQEREWGSNALITHSNFPE